MDDESRTPAKPVRLIRRRKDGNSQDEQESRSPTPKKPKHSPEREPQESRTVKITSANGSDPQKTPIPPGGIPPVDKLFNTYFAEKMASIEKEHQNKKDDIIRVLEIETQKTLGLSSNEASEKEDQVSVLSSEDPKDIGSISDPDSLFASKTGSEKSKHKKKKKKKDKEKDQELGESKNEKDNDRKHKHKHKKKHKHKHRHKIESRDVSRSRSRSRSLSRSRSQSREGGEKMRSRFDSFKVNESDRKLDLSICVGKDEERRVNTTAEERKVSLKPEERKVNVKVQEESVKMKEEKNSRRELDIKVKPKSKEIKIVAIESKSEPKPKTEMTKPGADNESLEMLTKETKEHDISKGLLLPKGSSKDIEGMGKTVLKSGKSKWDVKPLGMESTDYKTVMSEKPCIARHSSKWDVKEVKAPTKISKWDVKPTDVSTINKSNIPVPSVNVISSSTHVFGPGIKTEVKTLPEPAENLVKPKRNFRKSNELKEQTVHSLPLESHIKPNVEVISSDERLNTENVQTSDLKFTLSATASVEQKSCQSVPSSATGSKKPVLKLGIKISETSTALIQSGIKVETDPKKLNREEGEITESDDSDESSSEDDDEEDGGGEQEDGEVETGSENDKSKKEKKKKKKHKHEKHKKKKKKHKEESSKRKSSSSGRSKTPKKRRHSRSKSRSLSRSRSRSRSRSGSFDRQRGVWRSRSKERHRRSSSRSRHRRSRSRSRERFRGGWIPYRRYGGARSRSRSRSRERRPVDDLRVKIDKAKLREIAIANAYANMKTGVGPQLNMKADELAAFKAGGKSVAELTDFCKKISEKETADSSDEDLSHLQPKSDDDDEPFIHHPFKVRDPGAPIVMNIRNARQLPIMTPAEKAAASSVLRLQFPVSSGSSHRVKEEEWVPVEKPKPEPAAPKKPAAATAAATTAATAAATVAATAVPVKTVQPEAPVIVKESTLPVPAGPTQPPEPAAAPSEDKVFPDPPLDPINIGQVVSDRLSAIRRLQDNPNDVQATMQIYKANQTMSQWAQSKQLPGQFTGSTGANVLTAQELSNSDPRNQAWVKKDTLLKAAPVKPGIGMFLLQKMGWKQGEGLGKKKDGDTEPLMLEFKVDRKGLHAIEESGKRPNFPPVRDLSGKHPVSALVELCNKRRWGSPEFIMVTESGPDHKKHFLFKVKVNGMEYQPTVASSNKKHAKAQAATVCLQEFGLVPRNSNPAMV